VRDRLGSKCWRFVWPVSECPQESRPVKAPTLTPPDLPDGCCRGF
jgi:hypothetical protein